jgi:hypothetical protein
MLLKINNTMPGFRGVKFFAFFFVAVMLFGACTPKENIPGEFPDKEQMAEILAELYLAESVLSNRGFKKGNEKDEDIAPAYYKDVLDEYNLTTVEFDTIRKWYVAHPYHYQDVYDKVVLLVTRREAELKKLIKSEEEAADSLPEVEDLWRLERELSVSVEDSAYPRLPFSFSTDSIVGGQIRLSGFYRYLRSDMSKDAMTEMVTLYADSTADTISVALTKAFEKKPINLVADIDTLRPVIKVSGFLFQHDTATTSAVEFTEIRLEHMEMGDSAISRREKIKIETDVR